jgi:hypothetical protein
VSPFNLSAQWPLRTMHMCASMAGRSSPKEARQNMYGTGAEQQFRAQNSLPERDDLLRYTPEEAGRLVLRFKAYKGAFVPGDILGHIGRSPLSPLPADLRRLEVRSPYPQAWYAMASSSWHALWEII